MTNEETCAFCDRETDYLIKEVTFDVIPLCEKHYWLFADLFNHFNEERDSE